MSIIRARRVHHKIIRDSTPNGEIADAEASRAESVNGPVTALQGAAKGGRRMDRTITCRWCWEPLEEGSMFRLRRVLGKAFLAHVSCERRKRPQ